MSTRNGRIVLQSPDPVYPMMISSAGTIEVITLMGTSNAAIKTRVQIMLMAAVTSGIIAPFNRRKVSINVRSSAIRDRGRMFL